MDIKTNKTEEEKTDIIKSPIINDRHIKENIEINVPNNLEIIKNSTMNEGPKPTYTKKIGNYILYEQIGMGTFSKVTIGKHIITNEKVAIKILEKEKIIDSVDHERVRREIEILKNINHPNICQMYETYSTDHNYYLILEYIEGGDLFDYICEEKALSEQKSCYFFRQLIGVIKYLREMEISHRDIKPENILLDKAKENIKVIDFGLSNYCKKKAYLKSSCGSPCYASPEMLSGKPYLGETTDLWSVGICLYNMLVGSLPFDGQELINLYEQIKIGKFYVPSTLSLEAIDLLKKILNVDPNKRITLSEIQKHPWFNIEKNSIYKGIDLSKTYFPVNQNIIEYVMDKYISNDNNITENDLITMVQTYACNKYTALYFLLLRSTGEINFFGEYEDQEDKESNDKIYEDINENNKNIADNNNNNNENNLKTEQNITNKLTVKEYFNLFSDNKRRDSAYNNRTELTSGNLSTSKKHKNIFIYNKKIINKVEDSGINNKSSFLSNKYKSRANEVSLSKTEINDYKNYNNLNNPNNSGIYHNNYNSIYNNNYNEIYNNNYNNNCNNSIRKNIRNTFFSNQKTNLNIDKINEKNAFKSGDIESNNSIYNDNNKTQNLMVISDIKKRINLNSFSIEKESRYESEKAEIKDVSIGITNQLKNMKYRIINTNDCSQDKISNFYTETENYYKLVNDRQKSNMDNIHYIDMNHINNNYNCYDYRNYNCRNTCDNVNNIKVKNKNQRVNSQEKERINVKFTNMYYNNNDNNNNNQNLVNLTESTIDKKYINSSLNKNIMKKEIIIDNNNHIRSNSNDNNVLYRNTFDIENIKITENNQYYNNNNKNNYVNTNINNNNNNKNRKDKSKDNYKNNNIINNNNINQIDKLYTQLKNVNILFTRDTNSKKDKAHFRINSGDITKINGHTGKKLQQINANKSCLSNKISDNKIQNKIQNKRKLLNNKKNNTCLNINSKNENIYVKKLKPNNIITNDLSLKEPNKNLVYTKSNNSNLNINNNNTTMNNKNNLSNNFKEVGLGVNNANSNTNGIIKKLDAEKLNNNAEKKSRVITRNHTKVVLGTQKKNRNDLNCSNLNKGSVVKENPIRKINAKNIIINSRLGNRSRIKSYNSYNNNINNNCNSNNNNSNNNTSIFYRRANNKINGKNDNDNKNNFASQNDSFKNEECDYINKNNLNSNFNNNINNNTFNNINITNFNLTRNISLRNKNSIYKLEPNLCKSKEHYRIYNRNINGIYKAFDLNYDNSL